MVLEVKSLAKSFWLRQGLFGKREFKAVQNVNFQLRRGHTLGVVGESGSGKTTMGLTLLRLHEPTADAVLFANPIAIAACAADCVAATVGFGLNTLFWCAGCQGGLYPMDGHVQYHMGGVRTAALLAQRLTAKMHRELIAWGWHGSRGLCGPYFEPIMDKSSYKTNLTARRNARSRRWRPAVSSPSSFAASATAASVSSRNSSGKPA